jgi:hypothetical protein
MRIVFASLSIIAALSAVAPARAQAQSTCADTAGAVRPAVAFIWENDALVGADRDYTNGVGLAYSVPAGACAPLHGAAAALGRVFDREFFYAVPGLGQLPGRPIDHLTVGFSHQLYTPNDLSRADPDPEDRPYAAWAYYSVAFIRETGANAPDGEGRLSGLSITQLDVGAVGPIAQGEWLQRGFHDLINAKIDPAGWEHQIGNEPGLVIRHERMVASRWDAGPIDLELSLNAGAALGNVTTDISAGAGFRIGYNIGVDYGPPRLRPGLSAPNKFARAEDGPFSFYLFGGAGGRAVARNIFLDGTTFADSRSVEKKTLVGDYQLGAALAVGPAKVAATRVWRTDEFVGQGRDSAFDSLVFSWRY